MPFTTLIRPLIGLSVAAAAALLFTGPRATAQEPITEVVERLNADDVETKTDAIDDLADLGPAALPGLDALRQALSHSDAMVRAHAARAIGKIGPAAAPAAEDLAKRLTDDNATVRRWVVSALADVKPGKEIVPLMLAALQDKDPSVVQLALQTMAEAGPAVVPVMVEALSDERTEYWALLVLHEIGPDAKAAIPQITEKLDDDDPEVRLEAVLALGNMGEAAAAAVPALAKRVQDDESAVRLAAVYALGQIGVKAKPAEVAIVAAANNDDDAMLQTVALWTLARLNPESDALREKAAPKLFKALKHEERRVRVAAARAIFELELPAEQIVAEFEELLESSSEEVIQDALSAVAALGEEAVPQLIRGLEHDEIRLRVIQILGRIGEPAKEAVPALVKLASSDDAEVRGEALFALGGIGPAAAEQAVPVAVAALEDDEEDVRFSAIYTLGQFGPLAEKAVPTLRERIGDSDDSYFCTACVWALVRINPEDAETGKQAVPLLIKALDSPRDFVRLEAIHTLALLGKAAQPAKEKLEQLAEDDNPRIAAAAKEAIEAIGD